MHTAGDKAGAKGAPIPSRTVTSVEVLGFASWTGSGVAFVLYALWAYVPAETLASVGVTYYPSKYWATAVPLWFCLALVFACVAYECSNMLMVLPLDSSKNVTDEFAKVSVPREQVQIGSILPLADLPLDQVCNRLYGSANEVRQGQ